MYDLAYRQFATLERDHWWFRGRRSVFAAALSAYVPAGGPLRVVDIGSGLLDSACPWLASGPPEWLEGEPAARQTLERGASLVIFSGDKHRISVVRRSQTMGDSL